MSKQEFKEYHYNDNIRSPYVIQENPVREYRLLADVNKPEEPKKNETAQWILLGIGIGIPVICTIAFYLMNLKKKSSEDGSR